MKIHAHMHNQQDDDSLVDELEDIISPYVDVVDHIRKSLSTSTVSETIEDELKHSLISSQKEYFWISELLQQETDVVGATNTLDAGSELSETEGSLGGISGTVENILRLLRDDTLYKQDDTGSTTNYV